MELNLAQGYPLTIYRLNENDIGEFKTFLKYLHLLLEAEDDRLSFNRRN